MSQPNDSPIEQSPSSTWGCTCCPVPSMTLVASPADEPDTQQGRVRWASLLLSLHLSTFAAHLQESLVRQRGEVAKERTDAVHLMTQAEFDVKEMQESMQNSKRTQVSGGDSVTACPIPSCARLALAAVAAGCVHCQWLLQAVCQAALPMMSCSRAASLALTLTGQSANRQSRWVAHANSWHIHIVQICRCCASCQQAGCRKNPQPSVPADCREEAHRLQMPSARQL